MVEDPDGPEFDEDESLATAIDLSLFKSSSTSFLRKYNRGKKN
jgi:hypothetical protein